MSGELSWTCSAVGEGVGVVESVRVELSPVPLVSPAGKCNRRHMLPSAEGEFWRREGQWMSGGLASSLVSSWQAVDRSNRAVYVVVMSKHGGAVAHLRAFGHPLAVGAVGVLSRRARRGEVGEGV